MNKDYEDKEILDTENMLKTGFFKNLKQKNIKIKEEMEDNNIVQAKVETEKVLLDLYEVRDDLIDSFCHSTAIMNSPESVKLIYDINKIGSCIQKMGGEVEEFVPLNHISGLNTPDSRLNMQRVIETTQKCYARGQISNPIIKNNSIELVFEGESNNVKYSAYGTITPKYGWNGNEAIDYIYTSGAGRMSVKAFEKETWIDRSDDFDVEWSLEEDDNSENKNDVKKESKNIINVDQKQCEKKEKEIEIVTENNINDNFNIKAKKGTL